MKHMSGEVRRLCFATTQSNGDPHQLGVACSKAFGASFQLARTAHGRMSALGTYLR